MKGIILRSLKNIQAYYKLLLGSRLEHQRLSLRLTLSQPDLFLSDQLKKLLQSAGGRPGTLVLTQDQVNQLSYEKSKIVLGDDNTSFLILPRNVTSKLVRKTVTTYLIFFSSLYIFMSCGHEDPASASHEKLKFKPNKNTDHHNRMGQKQSTRWDKEPLPSLDFTQPNNISRAT